jgi:hypothetical protein
MMNIKNIADKNPYKVPDNYFEEVNQRIIVATSGDTRQVVKTGILSRFRPYFVAAASVTGFIILSYVAARYLGTERNTHESEEVYAETFTEPFINDIDIFTLEENAASIRLPDDLPGINKSDIIDYLILENIEIDDIYKIL